MPSSWSLNPLSAYLPSSSSTSSRLSSPSSTHSQRPSSFLWYVAPVRWLYPQSPSKRKPTDDAHSSNSSHVFKSTMSHSGASIRSPSPSLHHSPSLAAASLQHRPLAHTNHRKESLDSLNKLKHVMPKKLQQKHLSKRRQTWTPTEVVIYMAVLCTILSCAVWSYRIIHEAIATVQRYRHHASASSTEFPTCTHYQLHTTADSRYSYLHHQPVHMPDNSPFLISLLSTSSDCQLDLQNWQSISDILKFQVLVPCENDKANLAQVDYANLMTGLYPGAAQSAADTGRLYVAVGAENRPSDVLLYELSRTTSTTSRVELLPYQLCSVTSSTPPTTVAPARHGHGIPLPTQLVNSYPCSDTPPPALTPTNYHVVESMVQQY